MANRPVYRRPPRSHAYSCRCDRCAQFYNRRSASGSGGFWIVVLLMVLYGLPAGIWHRGTGFVVAAAIWWPLLTVFTVLCLIGNYRGRRPLPSAAGKQRTVRPPKGRLQVEATPRADVSQAADPPMDYLAPPVVPAEPACRHLNAVPVDLSTGERVAWLCPDCGEGLPAEFGRIARPCCVSAHGDRHAYNCRHFSKWKNGRP